MEPTAIRCAHCERVDTADIAPADYDALAASLGHDTATAEED